jgi:hypothetical protein
MPDLVRDEFNAYKMTMLQEYLYELLFKEASNGSSSGASTACCSSLEELPSLGEDTERDLGTRLQQLQALSLQFLTDVSGVTFLP